MVFKNTDVFVVDQYDTVVTVTQKAINDQVKHLAHPDLDVIKSEIVIQLVRKIDASGAGSYDVVFYSDWTKVPGYNSDDARCVFATPTLHGVYTPSIGITKNTTYAKLKVSFNSGSVWLMDPLFGGFTRYDMKDWSFSADVDLSLARMDNSALSKGAAVPPKVLDSLQKFSSADFGVTRLFMNFTKTDMVALAETSGPKDQITRDAFSLFMAHYFQALDKDPLKNPYVLGYAVTNEAQTNDPDEDVPDMFKPWRAKFSLYMDPLIPDRSLLSWVVGTVANKDRQLSTPHVFENSWLANGEETECDGKMIQSHAFFDQCILQPFYEKYRDATHPTIQKRVHESDWLHIDHVDANSYGQAIRNANDNSASFLVFGCDTQELRYSNSYNVKWSNNGSKILIDIEGQIQAHMERRRDMLICDALSRASSVKTWRTRITIESGPDSAGHPVLKADDPVVQDDPLQQWSDSNDCAKGWGTVAQLFGALLDVFTNFSNDFAATFKNFFIANTSGTISPHVILSKVFPETKNKFILPAGDVFFFKNPSMIDDRCFSSQITFKADDGSTTNAYALATAGGPDLLGHKVVSNVLSKVLLHRDVAHIHSGVVAADTETFTPRPGRLFKKTMRMLDFQPGGGSPSNAIADTTQATSTVNPPDPRILGAAKKDVLSLTLVDTVSDRPHLSASVSCELIHNTHPAMPIDPQKRFQVIQDHLGQAWVFSITQDDGFQLLMSTPGSVSGWTTVDLLAGMPAHVKAAGFDVSQDFLGRTSVALVVLDSSQKTPTTTVYAVWMVDADKLQSVFLNMHQSVHKIGGIPATLTAPSVVLSSSDDNKRPILTVEGKVDADHVFFQLQSADQGAKSFPLPFNVDREGDKLLAHQKGFNFGQRGNYFLYEQAGVQSLTCITIADAKDASLKYDYSASQLPSNFKSLSYNTIHTAVSRTAADNGGAASDIYLGCSTGLYRIANGKKEWTEAVTTEITDVHSVEVAVHGNDISAWALTSPNKLWYISGTRKAPTSHEVAWGRPIPFCKNALAIAPLLSHAPPRYNEIFVLTQELTLQHWWQSAKGGLWRNRIAKLNETHRVMQQESYTTHIHLGSEGKPVLMDGIKIASSQWQYCTINGLTYSLDHTSFAEVATDYHGNITIIGPANDLTPPVLHLIMPGYLEQLDIYPEGKLHYNIKGIQDGDTLLDAKDQSGKPVLDSNVKSDTADGVAKTLSKIRDGSKEHFAPEAQGRVFTAIQKPASTAHQPLQPLTVVRTPAISASASATSTAFGLKLGQEGLVLMEGHAAVKHASNVRSMFNIIEDVESWAGDFWHFCESVVDAVAEGLKDAAIIISEGISVVFNALEEGFEMLLQVGQAWFRLVLAEWKAIFRAVNFLLSLVGIDLKKVLSWFGHLFGWDHIWDTHLMYAKMTNNALDFGVGFVTRRIDSLRAQAKNAFASIDKKLEKILLPDDVKDRTLVNSLSGAPAQLDAHSPQGNYVVYHLQNSTYGDPQAPAKPQVSSDEASRDPLKQFYTDVVKPTFKKVEEKLGIDLKQLVDTVEDLTIDNILKLIVDVIETVVDTAAAFVDGLLVFVEDLISDIVALMKEEIEIPFFTDLYKWVLDLLFEKEEPFTLVNAVSFIAAIMSCTISSTLGLPTPDQTNVADVITNPGYFASLEAHILQGNNGTAGAHDTNAAASNGSPHALALFEGPKPPKGLPETMASFNFIASVMAIVQASTDSMKAATGFDEASTGVSKILRNAGKKATGWANFLKLTLGIAVVKSIFAFPIPYPYEGVLIVPDIISAASWLANSGFRIMTELSEMPPKPGKEARFPFLSYEPPAGDTINVSGSDMKYGIFAILDFLTIAASLVSHTISVTKGDEIPWQGWVVDVVSNLLGALSGLAGYSKQPELEIGCYVGVVSSFLFAYWNAAEALKDGKLLDFRWPS